MQVEKKSWCYVQAGSEVERREVELGRSNDKFVHILNGLDTDAQVVLNPTSIVEKTRQESGEIAPDSDASEAQVEAMVAELNDSTEQAAVASTSAEASKAKGPSRSRSKGKSKADATEAATPSPAVGGE